MKRAPKHLKGTFNKLSLKSRLLLAAAFWLSAMILAAGIGIPKLVSDYLVQDEKDQLSLSMDEITANIEVNSEGNLIMPSRLSDPRFNQPYSGLYWTANTKGTELRSRSLWDKKLTFEEDTLNISPNVKGANNEELIYIQKKIYLPEIKTPVTITIGLDEDPLEKTLQQLTGQLWVILGLLFSGILFLIGIQVSWSLRPLVKMQSELAMLRKGEQKSLSLHYPQEISPLVSDLNALLFHYQELLERARNHAGNLSHSLKTPLSVLKNELSYLTEEENTRLSVPINQLQEHIDYHLGRARMAGSMNILSVATSPSERVDAISMAFDKVYADREILLINELDTESKITVDKTDLDEMLGNLLENGYKWAHSMIRVHSSIPVNNQISIIIEDDGNGIPKEEFEHVLKRGFRLDESTPGTGLGLHIVNEMAHSYRGSLALDKSPMGGLKATLTFPLVIN